MRTNTRRTNRSSGPRAATPCRGLSVRLAVAALSLFAVTMCVPTISLAEEPTASTGISLNIVPTAKVLQVAAVLPSNYRLPAEPGKSGEVQPAVDIVKVDLISNTDHWGITVRLRQEATGKQDLRTAVAVCRLVSDSGNVLREVPIQNEEVLLEGNGARGHHTLFLEVRGLAGFDERSVNPEPVVDVSGWTPITSN